jgi:hypothetical protein
MLRIIAIASIIAASLVSQADEGLDIHAAQQIQICKQAIPPGYVIIAQKDSANCPKPLHNNSWYYKETVVDGTNNSLIQRAMPAH